jgi:FtsH-binding integral membrane protein
MQSGTGEYQTKTDEEPSPLAMDLGPPLPSEISKAPWRPKAAGSIAFFFGPVAGALVVAISLRRMGYQQRARKVMFLALGAAAVEAAILFCIPEVLARLVGFAAEIAFLLVFPVYMEGAFSEWQATDPSARPSSGWSAIGWGLVGTVVFLLIIFLVFVGLSPLLPEGR